MAATPLPQTSSSQIIITQGTLPPSDHGVFLPDECASSWKQSTLASNDRSWSIDLALCTTRAGPELLPLLVVVESRFCLFVGALVLSYALVAYSLLLRGGDANTQQSYNKHAQQNIQFLELTLNQQTNRNR